MTKQPNILVTRQEIARAGDVKAALDEALSLAALQMTPQAITAYEATGMTPAAADGTQIVVIVEVRDEQELREAIAAGAEAVVFVGVSKEKARRLEQTARGLREDVMIESCGLSRKRA